jgi:hypothetical protein
MQLFRQALGKCGASGCRGMGVGVAGGVCHGDALFSAGGRTQPKVALEERGRRDCVIEGQC